MFGKRPVPRLTIDSVSGRILEGEKPLHFVVLEKPAAGKKPVIIFFDLVVVAAQVVEQLRSVHQAGFESRDKLGLAFLVQISCQPILTGFFLKSCNKTLHTLTSSFLFPIQKLINCNLTNAPGKRKINPSRGQEKAHFENLT